jgi:type II secretory pathway component PulJ
MKKSWFTLPELVMALVGLAMVGLVIFGLYAVVHFVLKFW